MTIIFKEYDKNNPLDMLNKKLARLSKGRFELRLSKNHIWYLYDYDFREITRDAFQVKDTLDCMGLTLEFRELKELI